MVIEPSKCDTRLQVGLAVELLAFGLRERPTLQQKAPFRGDREIFEILRIGRTEVPFRCDMKPDRFGHGGGKETREQFGTCLLVAEIVLSKVVFANFFFRLEQMAEIVQEGRRDEIFVQPLSSPQSGTLQAMLELRDDLVIVCRTPPLHEGKQRCNQGFASSPGEFLEQPFGELV